MPHWTARCIPLAIPDHSHAPYERAQGGARSCDSCSVPFLPVPPSSSISPRFYGPLSLHPIHPLEMTLNRRQSIVFNVIDDQSPTLWGLYVGNWTHFIADQFNNGTLTSTPTQGDSLTIPFAGTQVIDSWLCCVALTLRLEQGLRRGSSVIY
jgi:hypothetical protein